MGSFVQTMRFVRSFQALGGHAPAGIDAAHPAASVRSRYCEFEPLQQQKTLPTVGASYLVLQVHRLAETGGGVDFVVCELSGKKETSVT